MPVGTKSRAPIAPAKRAAKLEAVPASASGPGAPRKGTGAAGAPPVRPAKPARAAQPAARRAPGRPVRKQGHGDVREALLDAAIVCFTTKGIAATSLREIATQAHVTPALLHYYYGDKAQLVEALVEDRMLPAFGVAWPRPATTSPTPWPPSSAA